MTETKNTEQTSVTTGVPSVSENMRFYIQVQDTPKEAQKQFNNGRFSGTDINPMWRIKKLTELFGPAGIGWWTDNEEYRVEKSEETAEVAVFCTLKLYWKDPNTGEISHGVTGIGGNKFIASSRSGMYCNDEAFKMAYTDALSIACKALGFSSDIYYSNDRTKYTMQNDIQAITEDVASLVREIDTVVRTQTKDMTSAEKQKYANEKIIPKLGTVNYKSCRDVDKMRALLSSLKAA